MIIALLEVRLRRLTARGARSIEAWRLHMEHGKQCMKNGKSAWGEENCAWETVHGGKKPVHGEQSMGGYKFCMVDPYCALM